MPDTFRSEVSLRPYVTLRAGGAAERFAVVRSADEFAECAVWAQTVGAPLTSLGWGSNVLPSDAGVPGLVVVNEATGIAFLGEGIVEAETGLEVKRVLSGPRGGDLQIGAMIAEGRVRAVVFLRDPLTAHPHEPDINALMKVCDIHNVPLATNIATADMLVDNLK